MDINAKSLKEKLSKTFPDGRNYGIKLTIMEKRLRIRRLMN